MLNINNKIIYSQKINKTEFLRSLSLNGIDTYGTNFYKFNDLIEDANVKLGFAVKEKILSPTEAEEKVLSFFTKDLELKNPSYLDVKHFVKTMNQVRHYIKDDDELNAIRKIAENHQDNKSLQLLKKFFENYLKTLKEDEIDILIAAHKLIDYAKKRNDCVYDEIICLKEEKLTPLEEILLSSLSKSINKVSILSLFNNDGNNIASLKSINPRYGTRNEVAHVIKDIIDNKYPLDSCQIVLMNKDKYVNELYKFSDNLKLGMTFECGLPIALSDSYKLYSSCLQLGDKYFFDVNGYLNLFSCESFDTEKLNLNHPRQIAQLMGRMKICFDNKINDEYLSKFSDVRDNHPEEFKVFMKKIDREINNNRDIILPELYHVIGEFSKGLSYIIKEYSKRNIKDEIFHKAATEFICDVIDYSESGKMPKELVPSYLSCIGNKYLCNDVFDDDSIHVTEISKALSNYRKHIYIVGLNSCFYPGNLTEDFLFSDADYEELCGIANITETSLNDKNKYLKNVIDTYLSLGKDVALSYNAQEISEVRELNPCSVLLDYAEVFFKDQNEENAKNDKPDELTQLKNKCSYYDDGLSSLKDVEDIAKLNQDIKPESLGCEQKLSKVNVSGIKLLDCSFSPSTLPKFLQCPLRFYLNYIICADNTVTYDCLRPMGGSRFGDLLHYVLEHFVKKEPNAQLSEILDYGSKFYDLYTRIDRSVSDDNLEKLPFLNSLENAYKFLTKNFVIKGSLSEEGIGYGEQSAKSKIGNIHFGGSIDLVTKDKDGNYYIVDYKTGSHVEHIENDPETCVQGLIYAQLFEKVHGIKISKLMFYYTRFNLYISFDNPCSDESKKLLLEKVELFENALKSLTFDFSHEVDKDKSDEICKYCKYTNICRKDEGKEVEYND